MSIDQTMTGRTALVTGAGSGIGSGIAAALARAGCRVAVNYHDTPDGAVQTVAAIRQSGGEAFAVHGDVRSASAVKAMVEEVVERTGALDVLVNNAGIQISRPSHELSAADFEIVLAVNLRGAFMCAREAIKRFLDAGTAGSIVNISSVHQDIPKPDYLGYSVSKGGMRNLTRTLALEYAGYNIRVNAIGPGATITPINRAWVDDPEKAMLVTSHIPLSRPGTADEMAGVTCFLASDDAAYITGQTIFVDGGLTLYADFREPWSSE